MNLIEFLRLPLEVKVDGVWLSGIEGEGDYIECWFNGQIYKHCFCKNNELHGEYKEWHDNGTLEKHCFCKNNKLHGEYKLWNEDGKLLFHYLYENGIKVKDYLK